MTAVTQLKKKIRRTWRLCYLRWHRPYIARHWLPSTPSRWVVTERSYPQLWDYECVVNNTQYAEHPEK